MNIDRNELDRYITGNYGEDQLQGEAESEFYGPWRVSNHKRPVTITDIVTVVWDDNGNPMCYAEDDYFLKTAVARINGYDQMWEEIKRLQVENAKLAASSESWERRARELEILCADRL